jgi:hypothetical protein
VKMRFFPRLNCHNSHRAPNGELDASGRGLPGAHSPREQRYSQRRVAQDSTPVSCSCFFFPRFCFDLVFGLNMKVVDNFIGFPKALVWHGNDFWFISYEDNTLSKFYETSA